MLEDLLEDQRDGGTAKTAVLLRDGQLGGISAPDISADGWKGTDVQETDGEWKSKEGQDQGD